MEAFVGNVCKWELDLEGRKVSQEMYRKGVPQEAVEEVSQEMDRKR